ncbi:MULTISPECIES: hypothetical protein [Streptomyces]|uniref:hypothetical protein n=1 Tax=Streptomyces TaxID=1883 RepID=UPI00141DBBBE|nr:hypothetical protein [Streptomyces sp. MBT27]
MGSFEEEWAQLKRDAVAMRLAGAGQGGAGTPDVKGSRSAWTTAGNAVEGLAGDVRRAQGALDRGQQGLVTGGGVESAAAQSDLYQSWKTYLDMVAGRCGRLRGGLERAGSDLFLTDKGVLGLFDAIKTHDNEDTPAVGGQGR